MDLLLLFIPAVILPIGLSATGVWWLLSENGEQQDVFVEDDSEDGR